MTTTSLLNWLWQSSLGLGLCWLFYHLLLRRERSFQFNRGLLLLAPALTALLPLLPRPQWWPLAPPLPQLAALAPLPTGPQPPGPDWLLLIYAAGVGLGLLRLGWLLLRLYRLSRRLPGTRQAGYVLRLTGGRLPTSSFGRTVFWDDTARLSPAEAAQLLAHELVHVRRHHSADQLWLRLCCAVLWCNPFAHLVAADLALTHEYQADAEALRQQAATPADYGRLLARLAARPWLLTHAFAASLTLSRIAMLHHVSPTRAWRRWAVLPVAALLLTLMAGHKADKPLPPPAAPAAVGKPINLPQHLPDYQGRTWRPGELTQGC